MSPHPSVHMLLSEVLKNMKELNEDKASETIDPNGPNTVAPQGDHVLVKADSPEEKRKVAENLKFEAKLIREDADLIAKQKEEMAEKILNTLGNKSAKKTEKKVVKSLGTKTKK